MDKFSDEVKQFTRDALAARLARCTPKQQAFFHRIYPHGVSDHKLRVAIDLCERTIEKNERLGRTEDAGY